MPAKSKHTTPETPPAKRIGVTARAVQIGVAVVTMKNWQKAGVDIFDDDAVRARLRKTKTLPPDLKPEWRPQVNPPPSDADPTSIDIETIIQQLSTATDKHAAQMVKTQIDGLLNAYKLREAAGKYVSKDVVREALIKVGTTFKAAVLRMEADLPPMLEGASPAQMQRIIREKVDEVLRALSEESSKVIEDERG
jgi:hypothetical protein